MDGQTMTVNEVLEITRRQLGEIQVPAALAEQVGLPIARAMGNLQAVEEALRRSEEENNGRAADL